MRRSVSVRPARASLLAPLFAALLSAPAWSQDKAPAAPAAKPTIVASFSILADMAQAVAGDRATVVSLIGPDADAHGYEPAPKDSRTLAAAQMILVNGLGFDDWVGKLAAAAKSKAPIIVASDGHPPLRAGKSDAHHHSDRHEHDRRRDAVDPHAWHDPAAARHYVKVIAAALSRVDPAGAADYDKRAAAYRGEIDAMEAYVRQALAGAPPERRKVIASHDAFAYFSRAFGVRFLSPQGVGGGGEPSAAGVARLIRQIRQEQIGVVFVESGADPRLAQRLAAETGARFGGKLYADALSPADGPAATYLGLMRWNAKSLADAMLAAPKL